MYEIAQINFNSGKQRFSKLLLKAARLDASFDFDGKLFHSASSLNEKLLCPLEDIFFGNLGSVFD